MNAQYKEMMTLADMLINKYSLRDLPKVPHSIRDDLFVTVRHTAEGGAHIRLTGFSTHKAGVNIDALVTKLERDCKGTGFKIVHRICLGGDALRVYLKPI